MFFFAFLVVIPEGDLLLFASVFNLTQPKHSSSRPAQQTASSSVAQWRDPRILFLLSLFPFC
jgi:hypothetical protein